MSTASKIGGMSSDSARINLTHHFLIAMPGLRDEAFAGSVVYLCEHSERGALGLVINKPSDINLRALFENRTPAGLAEALRRDPEGRARAEHLAEVVLSVLESEEEEHALEA